MKKILDKLQVLDIFFQRMEGDSLRDIAANSGISRQYVLNILNRVSYKEVVIPKRIVNIVKNYVPLNRAKSMQKKSLIRQLYKEGFTQIEIANQLKVGTATVCRTLKEKS